MKHYILILLACVGISRIITMGTVTNSDYGLIGTYGYIRFQDCQNGIYIDTNNNWRPLQ